MLFFPFFNGYSQQIQVDPDQFTFTIQQGATISEDMSISNTGAEDLIYQIEILNSDRDMWDVQFAYEMTGLGPQNAIAWDGEYFYIGSITSSDIHIFDAAGNYIGILQIPGKLSFRDFTWDGNYLYACNGSSMVFEIDVEAAAIVSTFMVPLSPRSIAWDHEQDAFWMGDWTAQLLLVDKSGAVFGAHIFAEQIFGMDYDNFSENGKFLWLLGYDANGFRYFQWDIITGMITGEEHYIGEDFGYEYTSSGLFVENDVIEGITTIGGLLGSEPPQFFGYELYGGTGEDWLSVEPVSGTVPAGESATVQLFVDGTGLEFGDYDMTILVQSNDPVNPEILVPVTLDVITSIKDYPNLGIEIFPNPATAEVIIRSNQAIQEIFLASLQGELLIKRTSCNFEFRLDISDLQSGIYIVEIKTENAIVVKKLMVE